MYYIHIFNNKCHSQTSPSRSGDSQDQETFLAPSADKYIDICIGRLLCRCKFESQRNNHEVKNCGKNCVSCPYLLKTSLYQFKRINIFFLLKNYFKCEGSNLIHVVICQGCKEEYMELNCLVK